MFARAGCGDRQQRRREQRGQDGRASPDRSPLETCDSHSLTAQRYQRPRETPNARQRAREAVRPRVVAERQHVGARPRRPAARAAAGRRRGARSRRPARARRRPRPRGRSPRRGRARRRRRPRRSLRSLQARGSWPRSQPTPTARERCGWGRTARPARRMPRTRRAAARVQTGGSPTRTSAASVEPSRAARHAETSTGRPLPAAGRPTNRNLTSAAAGQRGSLGGATSGERQKSLSTDCGATWTLRAPRAATYALTWGPYVTTASAKRYSRRSGR